MRRRNATTTHGTPGRRWAVVWMGLVVRMALMVGAWTGLAAVTAPDPATAADLAQGAQPIGVSRGHPAPGSPTIEERIQYQRAIEEVYQWHRIKSNKNSL